MKKAISIIVGTVLMLVIVITLVGTAYLFISGVFTSKTATVFSIIDSNNGRVTIRNDGTETIYSMTATVEGKPVTVVFPDGPIEPGTLGDVGLQGLPIKKQKQNFRLCSSSMCTSGFLEKYPIIAIYDADGENFYSYSWGRFSSNQIYNWLKEEGFAVAKISSNNLAGYHWGFEKGMTGWTTQNSPDETTTVNSIKRSGDAALKVRVDTSKSWSGVITEGSYLIKVKPNTRYLVEVYVYVPSSVTLTGKWEFHRHVYDAAGCGDGTCHHYNFIDGDMVFDNSIKKDRWVRKWVIIETWSDAQTFRAFFVTHGSGGSGTVYWDDFQLIELDNNNNPVEPERVELKDVDVLVISTGEGYPARGKSYENRGENIWDNIKSYLSSNGKMLVIGAYPFYYPNRWDGSNWILDCSLAPCYSSAMNELQLFSTNNGNNDLQATSIGQSWYSITSCSSCSDHRAIRQAGNWEDTNTFVTLFEVTTNGNSDIALVKYSGTYNGKLLKVSGGGPDQITALGGKKFIVESIQVLLNA